MTTRIGVDVGGTFTDLLVYDDETGDLTAAKERTTPDDPKRGIDAAIAASGSEDLLRKAGFFLHGTTVGLNTLLTRTGPTVGILATRGFRDTLEIRRGNRPQPYVLVQRLPPMLVPRDLRLPVGGRILADGSEHAPLDTEDVKAAATHLKERGVTSVAIAFLHSYANPAHELEAERILRDQGYDGQISLSHSVSGEYREYERTATTVIDAYVRPSVTAYLRRLEQGLESHGFGGAALVTRSGGGAMTFDEAERRSFETISSGPVAGVQGAAEIARNLGLANVITADVGGTSFDTAFIRDGEPHIMFQGDVLGLPVQAPWVDVRSIGAGGGSIAYVDAGGLLRVGPRSAGAMPGPACYAQGGKEATVTDAACVLGMLGPGVLAGGIRLRSELAVAVLEPLGQALGMSVEEVARGVLGIASSSMADAIREISVEKGDDPRTAALLAYGGAGPLFACLVARELDIGQIVIPTYGGNFSAWGLLASDLRQTLTRTRVSRLSDDAIEDAATLLDELFGHLAGRTRWATEATPRIAGLDIRYRGQEHSLMVEVPFRDRRIELGAGDLRQHFEAAYEQTFGHLLEDEELEIVSVRATLRTELPPRKQTRATTSGGVARPPERLPAYSFTSRDHLDFALHLRDELEAASTVKGPALILEDTTTSYVDSGFSAVVDSSGCLVVSWDGAE